MNNVHLKNYHVAILVSMLILVSCKKDEVSNSVVLKSYSGSKTENYSTQNAKVISVTNSMGGVIITGWSTNNSMQVNLDKTIDASSSDLANAHFDDIKFVLNTVGDTMNVSLESPASTSEIIYKQTSLSLEIPYNLNCIISGVNGAIFVDQLSSNVTVKNSANEVTIQRQEGSCEVTSSNNISAQMNVLVNGYCRLNTSSGNVSLSIPDSTNSTLNLQTDNGIITYTNLTISQLNQTSNSLTGELGSGNAEITLHTKKGDITVKGVQ